MQVRQLAWEARRWAEALRDLVDDQAMIGADLDGACALASAHLALRIEDAGGEVTLVRNEEHAWLLWDRWDVDVTATQFKPKPEEKRRAYPAVVIWPSSGMDRGRHWCIEQRLCLPTEVDRTVGLVNLAQRAWKHEPDQSHHEQRLQVIVDFFEGCWWDCGTYGTILERCLEKPAGWVRAQRKEDFVAEG